MTQATIQHKIKLKMDSLSVKEVFENQRTCNSFLTTDIPDSLLKEIYDIAKLGPTSANCCPLRIIFIKNEDAKSKLLDCLMEGNVAKTKTAPVVALFAEDHKFYEKMPKLFPHNKEFGKMYENNEVLLKNTASRNSVLQAAYFMIAARSKGLACGPMSGFDAKKLNESFFSETNYTINFICNLGYRAKEEEYPRLPKLEFNETCFIS